MTLRKAVLGRIKKEGLRVFFEKSFFQLKKGDEDFFSEKIRGAKTLFRLKKGGEDFFSGKFFPKPGLGIR